MHADAACVLAQAADADPLRNYAAEVVAYQNRERTEDVLRIAAFALGVPLERLEGAQLLWLDRLGIYLFAATVGGLGAQARPAPPIMPHHSMAGSEKGRALLPQSAWPAISGLTGITGMQVPSRSAEPADARGCPLNADAMQYCLAYIWLMCASSSVLVQTGLMCASAGCAGHQGHLCSRGHGRARRAEHADDARASGLGEGAQLHSHHVPCPRSPRALALPSSPLCLLALLEGVCSESEQRRNLIIAYFHVYRKGIGLPSW